MNHCEICDEPTDALVTSGGIAVCDDCHDDALETAHADMEASLDAMLERQELEDFEQTDEYFGDYGGDEPW